MSLTPSTMLPLGTIAPPFELPDVISGNSVSLALATPAKATLIMFICNHCPYVKHIQTALVSLANHYQPLGVRIIAINSNDAVAYPDDSPEAMKAVAKAFAYPFPYCFDESQNVAQAYQAACTPDFFLFDSNMACAYRGQFDDSRPNNGIPVTGIHLREAIDQLLANAPISLDQKPSIGCNIKWKSNA